MKWDEMLFMQMIAYRTSPDPVRRRGDPSVREIIESDDCPITVPKRAHRILEKWSKRDWYDYGVSLDLGWLTSLGRKQVKLMENTLKRD